MEECHKLVQEMEARPGLKSLTLETARNEHLKAETRVTVIQWKEKWSRRNVVGLSY